MKRELTASEKRTVWLGGVVLGGYLVLFFGMRVLTHFSKGRAEFRRLQQESLDLKSKLELYHARGERVQRYMESFQMDPARLTNSLVMPQAVAEIQKLGAAGGVNISSIRETQNRGAEPELGSLQVESQGPAPALLGFLHQLKGCGYPLVIDTVQISGEPSRPGPLKMSLTIVVLNFDRFTEKGVPRG